MNSKAESYPNVPRGKICTYRLYLSFFACLMLSSSAVHAQQNASPETEMERESLELFEKVIRPTLLDQCIRCHGPEKQKGGLRLDSQDGWKTGGDSGEAV
ncbi:MAG: c-type cytochrome domain-containing protein, partial [Planctomycetota bacterium]|nr:c-type cytochrome domain-containing protein [Planctomycetota bacterium]